MLAIRRLVLRTEVPRRGCKGRSIRSRNAGNSPISVLSGTLISSPEGKAHDSFH